MADAAAKHGSIRKASPGGLRRFDKETEKSTARFFLARMPQQEKRPSRRLRPKAEPPAFGEAEMSRIASDFENGRRQRAARHRRFRKP